jgi:hypothetical protein
MPRVVNLVLIIVVAIAIFTIVARASHPVPPVSVYDADPAHLWNRLYAVLLVRQDATGASFGADSLDPPLLAFSRHLLEPKSHRQAIQVLDEFLKTHGENLIHDPVKRAMFSRDLWAVFDWSVDRVSMRPSEPTYDAEKRELQIRLAEILRRLALTPKEIGSLPDNYAQAVASGEFPKEYDPAYPDRAFLPPDVFDQHGPWVATQSMDEPVAQQHLSFFAGRSRFLIFLRLPAGRKATYDYLRELWEFPQPWIARSDAPQQSDMNPALPSFPAGTEVALVRQMTMFDNQGNLVPAPITESIQIRVYRSLTRDPNDQPAGLDATLAKSRQKFYEIRLDRARLFAGKTGGLREVGRDEKELFKFNVVPIDGLDDPKTKVDLSRITPILKDCVWCHQQAGINSLNSRATLLKPNSLQRDPGYELPPRWWEQEGTIDWKQKRGDWGLLSGYWKAKPNAAPMR